MSATLVLVRHGRTAWNGERFLGRVDVPLDGVGREQAARLVHRLAGRPVNAIVTSPLRRARDTAAPLAAARGVGPFEAPELVELDCGALQGKLKWAHGKLAKRDPDEPFPGGESLAAAHARATRISERLRSDVAGGRAVVLVAHYVINQMVVGALSGLGPAASLSQRSYRPAPGVPYLWSGGGMPIVEVGTDVASPPAADLCEPVEVGALA